MLKNSNSFGTGLKRANYIEKMMSYFVTCFDFCKKKNKSFQKSYNSIDSIINTKAVTQTKSYCSFAIIPNT